MFNWSVFVIYAYMIVLINKYCTYRGYTYMYFVRCTFQHVFTHVYGKPVRHARSEQRNASCVTVKKRQEEETDREKRKKWDGSSWFRGGEQLIC